MIGLFLLLLLPPAAPPPADPAPPQAQVRETDLDALMARALKHRADAWKTMEQYILNEREQFELRGPLPVFPLPGVVLFPGALLPLHVFELRYRTMVRDALSASFWVATISYLVIGSLRAFTLVPATFPLLIAMPSRAATSRVNDASMPPVRSIRLVQASMVSAAYQQSSAEG